MKELCEVVNYSAETFWFPTIFPFLAHEVALDFMLFFFNSDRSLKYLNMDTIFMYWKT